MPFRGKNGAFWSTRKLGQKAARAFAVLGEITEPTPQASAGLAGALPPPDAQRSFLPSVDKILKKGVAWKGTKAHV